MADYRIYFLSTEGHIVRAEDIACASDGAALWRARTLRHVHPVEVWQGTRLVGAIPGALMEPATIEANRLNTVDRRWVTRFRFSRQRVTA